MEKFVVETEIYFWDMPHTEDEEVCYDVVCFDGYAVATKNELNKSKNADTLIVTYPTMAEVVADEEMADECTQYRYSEYYNGENLCYGDIMMRYGSVKLKLNVEKRLVVSKKMTIFASSFES